MLQKICAQSKSSPINTTWIMSSLVALIALNICYLTCNKCKRKQNWKKYVEEQLLCHVFLPSTKLKLNISIPLSRKLSIIYSFRRFSYHGDKSRRECREEIVITIRYLLSPYFRFSVNPFMIENILLSLFYRKKFHIYVHP